jgi:ArsR family transcriptional regulator
LPGRTSPGSHQYVLMDQASLTDDGVVRALADPLRRRIVELLAGEQLCTCHLVDELSATQTNISNHLRVLRAAGLIASEQAGRYTYHRLLPDHLERLSAGLADLASRARLTAAVKRPCG